MRVTTGCPLLEGLTVLSFNIKFQKLESSFSVGTTNSAYFELIYTSKYTNNFLKFGNILSTILTISFLGNIFQENKTKNYFMKTKDGDNYLIDFGEFQCATVDLTKKEAFNWYKG